MTWLRISSSAETEEPWIREHLFLMFTVLFKLFPQCTTLHFYSIKIREYSSSLCLYIHIYIYIYICIYIYVYIYASLNLPIHLIPLSPLSFHMFVLSTFVSVSALQTGSSVHFSRFVFPEYFWPKIFCFIEFNVSFFFLKKYVFIYLAALVLGGSSQVAQW